MDGIVYNIQRMSTKDGPGLRTTVFLKGSRRRGLAAAKGHAAAGIVIKQAVAVHDAHDFFHGHAFSGHFPRLGGAAFHAEAAIRADRTIPVVHIADLDHGTVRANPLASAAPHA